MLRKQRDEWRDASLINEKLRIDISIQRDEWRERAEFSYAERSKLERQRDELMTICKNVIERGIGTSDVKAMKSAIANAKGESC